MHFLIKQNKNFYISIFFISLFLIGIYTFPDFGIGVDEDNSRVNGFVSLKYIFEVFFPDNVFKINDIINVPNINNYGQQGNGVVFDLPAAFFELIFNITNPREIYLLRHLLNFLLFFTSVFFFYKIIKNRYNSYLTGIIGAAFLVLSPRIFAQSFYNTKDIFLMSLFIINIYTAINFLEKPNIKTAIIFSLISSLVTDVRILGIFLPALIFLIYIINILRDNNFGKKKILPLIFFLTSLPFLIILFWPYLWAHPIENFIEVFRNLKNYPYEIYNFYFGEYISAQNIPWHYPIVWIFITTPLLYLALFLIGFIFIVLRLVKRLIKIEKSDSYTDLWRGKKELQDLVFFLTLLIPLFIIIGLNSTLYDGWRHIYFIYPSFLMISLFGLHLIKTVFFKKKVFLVNILLVVLILPTISWMYLNHPFQNVYFNILTGKNFNKNFEMDYWGNSNKMALELISNKTNKKIKIASLNTSDLVLSKKILKKEKRDLIDITNDIIEADFVINNYRDWNGRIKPENYSIPENFKILYEIKVDDVIINTIYEKK